MMLRKLAIHIPKKDFRHVFTPPPIINSVWVKVLNLRGENVKLKETNIRTIVSFLSEASQTKSQLRHLFRVLKKKIDYLILYT